MSLKPWREIAIPHDDVLKGQFKQAELAADLAVVHAGKAVAEYQDARLFFRRTFITEGMRLLLDSVVQRLAGKGGDPVIRLQTAFGGGKTHTMMAVYHLAKGEAPTSEMPGVPDLLDKAGVLDLPKARVAVLDGVALSPDNPRNREGVTVNTLWGELAYQLGGAEGFSLVKSNDESGTSPGKDVLAKLIQQCSPCVILVDELVRYIAQFEQGKSLKGGSFDSNLSFVQALTESLKQCPQAVMLASLPESDKEAGSDRGVKTLHTLEHYYGRVQVLWKPVSTEEAFAIVRKRLFNEIRDAGEVEKVCRAYADFYVANAANFPPDTQESRYFERLKQAYPIHPEVFDRLYEDWSTNTDFQRTRGVLKLMAQVIHRLWQDGDRDPMIMPGSLPLHDGAIRTEAIAYLPQGWDPVIEGDIDGERSETWEMEKADTRFGSVNACRRVARTIFLGSAASINTVAKGVTTQRILLGSVTPGQVVGTYSDALNRISDKLHYLNTINGRHWFGTTPNLRREMEDRKRRFDDRRDILPSIEAFLRKAFSNNAPFGALHIFTPSVDIRDDETLRLVVLPPESGYSKSGASFATSHAEPVLLKRGDAPRLNQNRLLFLAPDMDAVSRLKDFVRSLLAWESIVEDGKSHRLTLDNHMQRNAQEQVESTRKALEKVIRESYKWLLSPMQDGRPGQVSAVRWDAVALNTSAPALHAEIDKTLRDNEWLISEWSPIHLSTLLKAWAWRDGVSDAVTRDIWQNTCRYLYLPRLKDEEVFRRAVDKGSHSRDYFGLAHGKTGEGYQGFSFGSAASVFLDATALLIEPKAAFAYAERKAEEQITAMKAAQPAIAGIAHLNNDNASVASAPPAGDKPFTYGATKPEVQVAKAMKRFFASHKLNPTKAKLEFNQIFDEIITQFNLDASSSMEISLDIRVSHPKGFSDSTRRAVSENAKTLKLGDAEFYQE